MPDLKSLCRALLLGEDICAAVAAAGVVVQHGQLVSCTSELYSLARRLGSLAHAAWGAFGDPSQDWGT